MNGLSFSLYMHRSNYTYIYSTYASILPSTYRLLTRSRPHAAAGWGTFEDSY